jgi:glutathione S-transferase
LKLFMFEHCSLCFRVRMTAALKRLHLQETVVLDDDSDTMIGLVGKRVIPILVKDCGQPMLESMDMVSYVDAIGEPVLTGPERGEVAAWADKAVAKTFIEGFRTTAPVQAPSSPWAGIRNPQQSLTSSWRFCKSEAHGHFPTLAGDPVFMSAKCQDSHCDGGIRSYSKKRQFRGVFE